MPTTAKTLRALREALGEAERKAEGVRTRSETSEGRLYSAGVVEGLQIAQRLVGLLCQ